MNYSLILDLRSLMRALLELNLKLETRAFSALKLET